MNGSAANTTGRVTQKVIGTVALCVGSLGSVVASVLAGEDALIHRRARRRSSWGGRWAWSGAASSSGALDDFLVFALLASLSGEVASILANKLILVAVFFLMTLFGCVLVWKKNGA